MLETKVRHVFFTPTGETVAAAAAFRAREASTILMRGEYFSFAEQEMHARF
jgi:hypothetical protein